MRGSLPSRVQRWLTRFYGLDAVPEVDAFVRAAGGRERLLVRQSDEGLEVALELPEDAIEPRGPLPLDALCQVLEGVSHFVLVTHRAGRDLSTSQLELEIQAEVDKFVYLALRAEDPTPRRRRRLMERLYDGVRYLDPEETEEGDRYRVANRLAARFLQRIEQQYLARARLSDVREELQSFYRLGPQQKLAYVAA